jgi:hypothetical protein
MIQPKFARQAFPTIWRQIKPSRWSSAMIDCSTPLACKAIVRATRSCATPLMCSVAARMKVRLAMQGSGVTPLAARSCRATRDKIARIQSSRRLAVAEFDAWRGQLQCIPVTSNLEPSRAGQRACDSGASAYCHKVEYRQRSGSDSGLAIRTRRRQHDRRVDCAADWHGYLSPSQTSELTDTLTEYSEGTIGPGHCDD